MNNIYKYNNDFDKSVIFDKIVNLEDKIQETNEEKPSRERNEKVRNLMYAQLMAGLRLNTGYGTYF